MRSLAIRSIAVAVLAMLSILPVHADEEIKGAGSTFAYPIISHWSRAYERAKAESDYAIGGAGLDGPQAGAVLDYEPVGSLAGTMRVRAGQVDFGASDVPLKPEELAKLGLAQFPIVIGGVVVAVNVDGFKAGELKLTGEVLADIFLGTIQNWADPRIKALNPDLMLPGAKIAVIHRSDGSGTTYNFADYLSKVSPAWKEKLGADTVLKWPVGAGAKGNDGMAAAVKQTPNSIAYVEYVQAMRAGLGYALVQNRAGNFVKPESASFQAAAAGADWASAGDFNLLLTDAPGDAAYPITATVFVQMRKEAGWLQRPQAALGFFRWSLTQGAKDAATLGYVPLPEPLVKQIEGYWAKTFKTDS